MATNIISSDVSDELDSYHIPKIYTTIKLAGGQYKGFRQIGALTATYGYKGSQR
ncbi:hypothetical protein J6590_068750 [Homalodisca vitripennis]|nr:hypothetical protein J6590_068750 [Homalodisca vitripennis]